MSAGPLVDKIDPFKRSPKKKPKKSQGSSRYHSGSEADLQPLPLLKGKERFFQSTFIIAPVSLCGICHILIQFKPSPHTLFTSPTFSTFLIESLHVIWPIHKCQSSPFFLLLMVSSFLPTTLLAVHVPLSVFIFDFSLFNGSHTDDCQIVIEFWICPTIVFLVLFCSLLLFSLSLLWPFFNEWRFPFSKRQFWRIPTDFHVRYSTKCYPNRAIWNVFAVEHDDLTSIRGLVYSFISFKWDFVILQLAFKNAYGMMLD